MKFLCDKLKGGCDNEFNAENIENEKYIQCPHCSRITKNPLYKEK